MQEQQIGLVAGRSQLATIQPIVGHRVGGRISQCLGEQLPYPLQRMLFAPDAIASIVKARGQRFTGGIAIQTGHRSRGISGQPGALEQPLCVDHEIVAGLSQARLETLPFAGTQRP